MKVSVAVLEPISVDARLRLNQKPEADESNWTTPKVLLNVAVEVLGLHIGKYQVSFALISLLVIVANVAF
jgi:hypothetical protein